MELLEELERRVRLLIEKTHSLERELVSARSENAQMQQVRQQLEALLVEQKAENQSLLDEKAVVKATVDEILQSIAAVEASQQ